MGGKQSNQIPANRPESGGADRDMIQEKSGILDREKNEFAAAQKAKQEPPPGENPRKPDASTDNRQPGDVEGQDN